MKRIVYPQRGSGSVRTTISARQVTVRYRPSKEFLQRSKNGRKQGFHNKTQALESPASSDPNSRLKPIQPQGDVEPDLVSHANPNSLKLPRLRAFLDGVDSTQEAVQAPVRQKIERDKGATVPARSPDQPRLAAGPSAYEELQALWRRK